MNRLCKKLLKDIRLVLYMPRFNRFRRRRGRSRRSTGSRSSSIITEKHHSRSGSLQISRPIAKNSTGYLKVKQKVAAQFTITAGTAETGEAFVFRLSDLIQATEFTRLFDSYRLNGVKITMAPLTNSSITVNPSYKMLMAIDLDDDTTPTANSLLQRANCKIKTVTSGGSNPQVFSAFLRPRYLTQLYETGTSTGYGQGARKQWLDTADDRIPHYGFKVVWDTDPTLNYDVVWQFYFTYYIEFKSLR